MIVALTIVVLEHLAIILQLYRDDGVEHNEVLPFMDDQVKCPRGIPVSLE
jgi:hypothetical protein